MRNFRLEITLALIVHFEHYFVTLCEKPVIKRVFSYLNLVKQTLAFEPAALKCYSVDKRPLFYIDGSLDSSHTAPAYNMTDSSSLAIGVRGDNFTGHWDGMLDGFRLYDRDLTNTEQSDLFNYT